LRKLIPSYWVGSRDRSQADVHARHPIRIRLETTFDAVEPPPVLAVASGDVAALGAGLACVLGLDFNEWYPVKGCLVCQCMSEEPVWYSIRLASALPRELPPAPSQVSQSFDGDLCVVSLGEFSDCFGELPNVCANVVSLPAAEPFQFESCLAPIARFISVFLEFGSAILEADLLERNVSSQVELPQNPAVPRDGDWLSMAPTNRLVSLFLATIQASTGVDDAANVPPKAKPIQQN